MMTKSDEIEDIAAKTLLAASESIPPATIDPRDYWPRLQSALKASAMRAESWQQFTTVLSSQLQIPAYTRASADAMHVQQIMLGDRWPEFRRTVAKSFAYIVASARIQKDEAKELARRKYEESE